MRICSHHCRARLFRLGVGVGVLQTVTILHIRLAGLPLSRLVGSHGRQPQARLCPLRPGSADLESARAPVLACPRPRPLRQRARSAPQAVEPMAPRGRRPPAGGGGAARSAEEPTPSRAPKTGITPDCPLLRAEGAELATGERRGPVICTHAAERPPRGPGTGLSGSMRGDVAPLHRKGLVAASAGVLR